MNSRRWFWWTLSGVLTVCFIVLLVKVSKLDLRVTVQQLKSVSWVSFSELVLLTGVHVYLSNLKWRLVDGNLRGATDSRPSRVTSFALTSAGVVLGQVLPIQVSMSVARTLGTYFYGRALRRGTGGTLFEQAFDVLVVGLLAIATGVTVFFRGGGRMWGVCSLAIMAVAILAVGPAVKLIRLHRFTSSNRIVRSISRLQQSVLMEPALARQLMGLSAARFVIQVLMAGQAAVAIGVNIPLWHFAAALPFVIIACVIVVTPGGLGVNELSYSTTLHLFGTPLNVGAQWALANRVLVASSCLVVAACVIPLLGLARIMGPQGQPGLLPEDSPR
jgi:uncharacterized membrane protein YbhN (UPF0104 family)